MVADAESIDDTDVWLKRLGSVWLNSCSWGWGGSCVKSGELRFKRLALCEITADTVAAALRTFPSVKEVWLLKQSQNAHPEARTRSKSCQSGLGMVAAVSCTGA